MDHLVPNSFNEIRTNGKEPLNLLQSIFIFTLTFKNNLASDMLFTMISTDEFINAKEFSPN